MDDNGRIPTFEDSQQAFEQAIREGRLSRDSQAPNYAGLYIYMGHWSGKALFKNRNTRKYAV